MPLFQAVRRYKKWPVRLPLHDGRECPDCGALVAGDRGQDGHRAYHEAIVEWQEWAEDVMRQTAAGAGLAVWEDISGMGETRGLDLRDDEQHDSKRRRVPWLIARTEDYDDRLTRKARAVTQLGGGDDDGEDD